MESLKKYNDWQNVLDYAHEEGYQEAVLKYEGLLQEAIKQTEQEKKRAEEKEKLLNEEKKRAEEEKKRAEQERKKLIETAKWLLSLGMSIDTISEKTGLTKEEIEKL